MHFCLTHNDFPNDIFIPRTYKPCGIITMSIQLNTDISIKYIESDGLQPLNLGKHSFTTFNVYLRKII